MAHYDLEEQEQIASLKTWWNMYGNLLTTVVTVACLAVIGWQAGTGISVDSKRRQRRFIAFWSRLLQYAMPRRSKLRQANWLRSLAVRPTPPWVPCRPANSLLKPVISRRPRHS